MRRTGSGRLIPKLLAPLVLVLALGFAACGGDDEQAEPAQQTTAATPAAESDSTGQQSASEDRPAQSEQAADGHHRLHR